MDATENMLREMNDRIKAVEQEMIEHRHYIPTTDGSKISTSKSVVGPDFIQFGPQDIKPGGRVRSYGGKKMAIWQCDPALFALVEHDGNYYWGKVTAAEMASYLNQHGFKKGWGHD